MTTALGVPSIVDGVLFVGASDGHVYALDSQSGCLYWSYAGTAGVRVAPDDVDALVDEVRARVAPEKSLAWWLDPDAQPADLE